MDIYVRDGSIIVSGVSCFDLARSCDCGQAFRWKNTGNGWFGVAGGRGATVRQTGETLIITPGRIKMSASGSITLTYTETIRP